MKTAAIFAAIISLSVSASSLTRAEEPLRTLTEADRDAIVSAVVKHFREHPEEIVESIMGWRAKTKESLDFVSPTDPVSGNPDGDVTIVEFFDAGCPPCRTMSERIAAFAETDRGVRIVHKDYPVSGPDAVYAAKMLLTAFQTEGTRQELLKALPAAERLDSNSISIAAAASIKGPVTKIVTDRVTQVLEANRRIAAKIGIRELPAVAIGSKGNVYVLTGLRPDAEIAAVVSALRDGRPIE